MPLIRLLTVAGVTLALALAPVDHALSKDNHSADACAALLSAAKQQLEEQIQDISTISVAR